MSESSLTPEKVLLPLRFVWGAVLADILIFGGLTAWKLSEATPPAIDAALQQRQIILYVAMVVAVGVGLFTRMQLYKRYWRGDRVAPGGYFTGNLVLFILINAVALASVLLCLNGDWVPAMLYPAGIMAMLMVLNFPTGSPMQAHPCEL